MKNYIEVDDHTVVRVEGVKKINFYSNPDNSIPTSIMHSKFISGDTFDIDDIPLPLPMWTIEIIYLGDTKTVLHFYSEEDATGTYNKIKSELV